MHKIIVAGHTCVDLIPTWDGKFEDIAPGHLIVTGEMRFSTGGSVPNTGVDLKRLGLDPIMIGKIGNDLVGRITLEVIRSNGEDLTDHMIRTVEAGSSYTLVLSPPNVDRAFFHYPGVNDTFCAEDIPFDDLDGQILHFGYPPVMEKIYKDNGNELVKIFQNAHEHKMITSLDMTTPDPNSSSGKLDWKIFLRNVLPYTDIFLPSLDEILYMMKIDSSLTSELLQRLSDQLIEWGAKIVMIKLGENGIYFRTKELKGSITQIVSDEWSEREFISPAFDVKVVGTNGAGDASVAGFLTGLVRRMNPIESVIIASAVGAFCVEDVDSTSGIKPLPAVFKRIKRGWKRLPVKIRLNNWKNKRGEVFLSPRDRYWSEEHDRKKGV